MSRQKSSRVQGAWAASSAPRKDFRNAKSDKPSSSNMSWRGKQSAETEKSSFIFQPVSAEEMKEPPKLRVIREDGECILGRTENGDSKIYLETCFISEDNADWMFETLLNEIQWKHERNHKYDKPEARLTEWFSDHPYTYSGVVQKPNPNWHPLVTALCDQLNEKFKLGFNSVLANYYRDGHDSVDWHTDSEPALGRCPSIASISFGDTRNFELREILRGKTQEMCDDFTFSQHYQIPLKHGSLLLMLGAAQHDWQHRIPKEYHDRQARINLTFRYMDPNFV